MTNRKQRSTADMIADLLELVQRELGHPLPGTSRTMIAATLAERYGGTRIYVPALPKAVTRLKVAQIGSSMSSSQAASYLGITRQRVNQLKRG